MSDVDEGVAAARAKLVANHNGTPTEDGFVTPRGAVNRWRGDTATVDHVGWVPGRIASVCSRSVGHIIKSGFETMCGKSARLRAYRPHRLCAACAGAVGGDA